MAAFGAALTVVLAASVALICLRRLSDLAVPIAQTVPARLPFAGGSEPQFHAWNRFHVRYYAMALLFLAFDMEMVFMYPWAVVFVEEGVVALVEMAMFIAILVLGILYAWREGALSWA
jgi:NADH-quinone oxidoreductase subunit A